MLVLKLTLVPALIAVASIVAQRFGAAAGGWITGFPIVGGPIFLMLVAEHGEPFGIELAAAMLIGMLGWAAFMLCYAWVCRRCHWGASMMLAAVVFAATIWLLRQWPNALMIGLLVGVLVPVLVLRLMPRISRGRTPASLPRFEILLRMFAAAVLVLVVAEVAHVSGPQMAGLVVSFPVGTSVLTVFAHRLNGPVAAIQSLRGTAAGISGYALFFVVMALLLPVGGIWIAAPAALAAALAVQGVAYRFIARG